MKSGLVILALILSVLSLTRVHKVSAQSEELRPEDVPNWCEYGQEWGDGRCENDDPWIETYMWKAGWCHAMHEAGLMQGNINECILMVTGGIIIRKPDTSSGDDGDENDEEPTNDDSSGGDEDDGDE